MTRAKNNYAATVDDAQSSGEILLLPDGRILAHNLTPALARLLAELDPTNTAMAGRARAIPLATDFDPRHTVAPSAPELPPP